MYSKTIIFVAFIAYFGISKAIAQDSSAWVHQQNNLNLMSLMSRSNDIMQRNPSRSLDCFNYYIPLINEIAEIYQKNFNGCLKTSDDSRAKAEADTLDQRNDLANRASTSCELLSKCKDIESAESVFDCFVNGGSENAKSMYAINADASVHLADLQENLRLIVSDEYKCTNETKRTYEKDSTKAYDDFNSCVLGLTEPPKTTQPPATTSPVTEASTTDAPATDAPATDAPATDVPATESSENSEVAPEDKLPEEGIDMLRKALTSLL